MELRDEGKKVPKELEEKAARYDSEFKTLDKYVKMLKANRKIPVYNTIDFVPYLKRDHPTGFDLGNTFNVFTGFPLDGVAWNGVQTFEQSRIYTHLRDEMFPGNPGELEHFLDFVSDMIQQPAKLRPVAHVFFTEQGCGKGLIVEWIKSMLGQEHVIVFNSTTNYFQKFNVDRMNKILNVLEELSERGECFSQHNQLKADMTSPTNRIEWKGGAIVHMRNFSRYIFNSNNENTLNVEHDDRRLTMHRGSSRMANNEAYFGPLWKDVRSREFAVMSFNYMADRKYDESNVMRAYNTNYKRDQKLNNLSNPIKFMIHCIETRWEGILRENGRVPSSLLDDNYNLWCSSNRLKVFAHATFIAEIKKLGIEAPRVLSYFGKKQRCLEINDEILMKGVQTYMRCADLQLDIVAAEDVIVHTPYVPDPNATLSAAAVAAIKHREDALQHHQFLR